MKLRPGRFAAIVIVAAWAVAFATHLSRSYVLTDPSAEIVDLTAPTEAKLTQRGVYYRGTRIGFVREKLAPLKPGFRAEQEGRFILNVLGRQRQIEIAGAATLDDGGRLEEFSFRLATSSGRSTFETVVLGKVEGQELALTVRSGGGERSERRRLAEPIVLPLGIYHRVAALGLSSGSTYRLRLFDPLTLTDGEADIRVLEPEVVRWGEHEEEAYRLRTRFAGLTTTAWVNQQGEVLKEETPLGWTLLKEAPGSAMEARAVAGVPDVVSTSAVPAIGFAGDAGTLKYARLKLNQFPSSWSALEGGRQRIEGEEVIIQKETLPPPTSAELPQDERRQALASDAFIQADDLEIRALAERLTLGLSPLASARRISEWVYESVSKTPTLSLPSAREVLEQRAGDCNEHAVLFTALARATGVPTRICTGLAFSQGQFYYHAWPEVWVGSWLAIDPTFGQFPADPLHLRLLTGGLEKQYEVLNLLGRGATIEILEAR
ncbi:MAG: transglutaminase-like domain-containing protein [Acidobacteriota bacterium]